MFCKKIYFLEPEPIGAELLKVEPEPRKNGSAPQHCLTLSKVKFPEQGELKKYYKKDLEFLKFYVHYRPYRKRTLLLRQNLNLLNQKLMLLHIHKPRTRGPITM